MYSNIPSYQNVPLYHSSQAIPIGSHQIIDSNYLISNYLSSQAISQFTPQIIYSSSPLCDYNQISSGCNSNYFTFKPSLARETVFVPDSFLSANRPFCPFLGKDDLMPYVKRAFTLTTGKEFPSDVRISIVEPYEFYKQVGPGVVGFAINRKDKGQINDIMILNQSFDKVMVTIGHEIGHVLTSPRIMSVDEEAKAYSFCLAWLETIKNHNVGDLGVSIQIGAPAKNNLHDKALDYVLGLYRAGKSPIEIFEGIIDNKFFVL